MERCALERSWVLPFSLIFLYESPPTLYFHGCIAKVFKSYEGGWFDYGYVRTGQHKMFSFFLSSWNRSYILEGCYVSS